FSLSWPFQLHSETLQDGKGFLLGLMVPFLPQNAIRNCNAYGRVGGRMTLPEFQILYFEDLGLGMTESYAKTVKSSDLIGFAEISGDRNPIHLSEHFAAKTPFKSRIAHGLYTASLLSALIGTRLPGPGAIYISQTLNFKAPVKIGD